MLKSVCKYTFVSSFSSFIMLYKKNLWSRELFGKWRHNRLAKGNAHRVNNDYSDKAAWELYLGLMLPCLWWTVHVFGTELIRNLAIWLAESRDYHLYIYKVYWYHWSMPVPIFTSFGIENSSQHSCWPRTLLTLISLFIYFYSVTPHVSTRGIASFILLFTLPWKTKLSESWINMIRI